MHRKDIKSLKRKAGIKYHQGDRKEAYEMWAQADKERKLSQFQKGKKTEPVKTTNKSASKNVVKNTELTQNT